MARGGGGRRSPPQSRGGGGGGAAGASLRRSRRFVRCPSPDLARRSASSDLCGQEALRHKNVPLHLPCGSLMQARLTYSGQERFDAAAARVAAWQQSRFSSPGSLLEEGEVSPGIVPASLCDDCVHAPAAGLSVDPVLDASPCTPSAARQSLPGSWSVDAACNLAQDSSCMPTVRQIDARCCPAPSGTVTSSAVKPPAGIGDPCLGVSGVDGFMGLTAAAVGVGLLPEVSLPVAPAEHNQMLDNQGAVNGHDAVSPQAKGSVAAGSILDDNCGDGCKTVAGDESRFQLRNDPGALSGKSAALGSCTPTVCVIASAGCGSVCNPAVVMAQNHTTLGFDSCASPSSAEPGVRGLAAGEGVHDGVLGDPVRLEASLEPPVVSGSPVQHPIYVEVPVVFGPPVHSAGAATTSPNAPSGYSAGAAGWAGGSTVTGGMVPVQSRTDSDNPQVACGPPVAFSSGPAAGTILDVLHPEFNGKEASATVLAAPSPSLAPGACRGDGYLAGAGVVEASVMVNAVPPLSGAWLLCCSRWQRWSWRPFPASCCVRVG